MKEDDKKAADGPALWRQARDTTMQSLSKQAPGADGLDLAAYLDGRLDEPARARVEAALAASPQALELVLAAREALEAGTTAAPDSLVARAQALVSDPTAARASPARRLVRLFGLSAAPRRTLAFATVAGAFLLVSVAGFELGRAEYDYSARVDSLLAREVGSLLEGNGEDFL